MENIFLPIANMEINPSLLFGVGIMGGIIAGTLGMGSGIILNPILMMIGIPSNIAVPSQLNNAVGINFSGFISYWRNMDVDFKLGWYILFGGILGGIIELLFLEWVSCQNEQLAFSKIFTVIIIIFLAIVVLRQNLKSINTIRQPEKGPMMRHWMIYFPFHKIFMRSRTEMSILIPIGVGCITGMTTSSIGGSSNLLIAPILTYLIGRTSHVVTGTSLLAGLGINLFILLVHGINQTPADLTLVSFLIAGGTIGSVIGNKISYQIEKPYLGIAGSIAMLIIAVKFLYDIYHQKWEHRYEYNHFEKNFPQILKKLQSNEFYDLFTPLIKMALFDPFSYTIISILFVICLVTLIQTFLNKFSVLRK